MKRQLLIGIALGLLVQPGATDASRPAAELPGLPATPTDATVPTFGIVLAPGKLRASAADDATEIGTLVAGEVLRHYGETTDAFGRTWQIVADPAISQIQQMSLLVPFQEHELESGGGLAAFLNIAPPRPLPPASAEEGPPAPLLLLPLPERWWLDRIRAVGREHLPEFGEAYSVQAYRLSAAMAEWMIGFAGGREVLAPWPDQPLFGQLHIPVALPLVFRWNGAWELLDPPRLLLPFLSLLSNPALMADTKAPSIGGGVVIPCWRLVGALDAFGNLVGSVAAAPEPAERVTDGLLQQQWPADSLGRRNLEPALSEVAPDTMVMPKRLSPPVTRRGLLLEDRSPRQAVFVEQQISGSRIQQLRGRLLDFTVRARNVPSGEGSATVGIEIMAAEQRTVLGAPVGQRTTQVTVAFVVPEEAERIRVRILPTDPSVALEERGPVIIESAILQMSDWSLELPPEPLLLQRSEIVYYEPVRRLTRVPLVVSQRSPRELRAVWRAVERAGLTDQEREPLLAGELRPGMSPQHVRLAWGEPDAIHLVRSAGERWEYSTRSASFGSEGLVSWSLTELPPEEQALRCLSGVPDTPTSVPERPASIHGS